MQQVTGRLTADATIRTIQSGQQVVSFNLADNQDYKRKGSDEWTKNVTFFSCAYWRGTGIAKILRKGAIVQLLGQVKARAYQTATGNTATALGFNAREIQVIQYAPKAKDSTELALPDAVATGTNGEGDLPF